jgi:hypothetical protein
VVIVSSFSFVATTFIATEFILFFCIYAFVTFIAVEIIFLPFIAFITFIAMETIFLFVFIAFNAFGAMKIKF